MSLSTSLANALSGLTASARSAEVVSSNIANAMTEGYGVRDIGLATQSLAGNGAGVTVVGVTRNVDQTIIDSRRLADASLGYSTTTSSFMKDLEESIGIPEEPGSLSTQISEFEAALIQAASRPDSEVRLTNVVTTAQDLATKLKDTSDQIQNLRMQADAEIEAQLNFLGTGLSKVKDLNTQILTQLTSGNDATALMDQRQIVIDEIAAIIPMQQVPRDHGQVALITETGGVLLDGKAAEFTFTSVGVIVPEMSVGAGSLSGLQINGFDVTTTSERNAIAGGSLQALFDIRDDLAVRAQADLDAVARSLVERFADPAVDGTTTGGLFTDAGADFLVADEIALSSRLAVAVEVDPEQGGAVWRVRDGIGAVAQGNVGDATILNNMTAALNATLSPASGSFSTATRSFGALSSDFLSKISTQRQSFDADQSFANAQATALKAEELAGGVDTDQELQELLIVEKAYAANARIISTIDEMLELLLRM